MDPLKYYKTPLTGKAKEQYDANYDLIFNTMGKTIKAGSPKGWGANKKTDSKVNTIVAKSRKYS